MSVFKGNKVLYQYELSDTVVYNLVEWLNYGLLEAGGFTCAKFNNPASGLTNLKRSKDNSFTDGRVYEGFGPSWAWETDVVSNDFGAGTIFQVSGVFINNNFFAPSTSGQYPYYVDYEHGRIVFNSAIPQSSGVRCEYTFRDVLVSPTDTPSFKKIMHGYEDLYNSADSQFPSGLSSVLKQNRVWLPAVFVETQKTDHSALQLGGGELINFNMFYSIFSDNPAIRKSLLDIINSQEGKTIDIFNINTSPRVYNNNGSLYSGRKTYKELSNREGPYYWRSVFIQKSNGQAFQSKSDVFRAEVRQRTIVEGYGFT